MVPLGGQGRKRVAAGGGAHHPTHCRIAGRGCAAGAPGSHARPGVGGSWKLSVRRGVLRPGDGWRVGRGGRRGPVGGSGYGRCRNVSGVGVPLNTPSSHLRPAQPQAVAWVLSGYCGLGAHIRRPSSLVVHPSSGPAEVSPALGRVPPIHRTLATPGALSAPIHQYPDHAQHPGMQGIGTILSPPGREWR